MIQTHFDSHSTPGEMTTGASQEPIAVIGLGCRFPGGANDWRGYWHLLENRIDAISETPAERWNLQKFFSPDSQRPGKTQSRWGGYVEGIDQFDPQLFGISPREAACMDPQQRMLLEVAFRAMEDAGTPLDHVAGEQVGVFVGISSFDYAVASLSFEDRGVIDAYSNTGGSSSIAANRISYCFDLRGPSLAVDTACSSSLVAIHLACESLWRGDATMALAGGVNALLLPDFYVAFSQLGVLSPDGRCKSFDARANGYVRSEGAGMVLLKPLSDAIRDKNPVYAVVRGTALNQDGRTPGMTVPSQQAQEELIRSACAKAQIRPEQVQYVEAHGTGTPVGDPIEAAAIGHVFGAFRDPNFPCYIGSVKSNIGHLEAGAGIASFIKVVLSLAHRRIPANLHFVAPNPAIDFSSLGLQVPTESRDWSISESSSSTSPTRLAGINGFGYGGANAHVIVEQAPADALAPCVASTSDQVGARSGLIARDSNGRPNAQSNGQSKRSDLDGHNEKHDQNGQNKVGGSGRLNEHKHSRTTVQDDRAKRLRTQAHLLPPILFPVSGRTVGALRAQARTFADWIEKDLEERTAVDSNLSNESRDKSLSQRPSAPSLAEAAAYLAHRRTHFNYRAAVCGTDSEEILSQLRRLAHPELGQDETIESLSPQSIARGAAFVLSGQGPQWWAMGRGLLKYSPVFRSAIKRCDAEFGKLGSWSLIEELSRDEATSCMQQTSIAQPSLFALQVGLAEVWKSWGVTPAAIVGHSVGEIAAAYLSGALSLEDAACVAFHRGRTMDLATSHGAMLAAGLSPTETKQWLSGFEGEVSVAAVNGPSSVTVSGAAIFIESLAGRLERAGIFCRLLDVEYAFHSPQMDPVREALLESLAHIQPRKTQTPMLSTVTGKTIDGKRLDAQYWWQNVRESVLFYDAMTSLADLGFGLAIELGPHPVLAYSINESFQDIGCSVRTLPSLNRQQDDLRCMTRSLATLYSLGWNIDWTGFYNTPKRALKLPTYPFELQKCWSESLQSRQSRLTRVEHPLLGERLVAPAPRWQQRVDLNLQDYLRDHTLRTTCVYPAAAMIETSIAAVCAACETSTVRLERMQIQNACVLEEQLPQWIQTDCDVDRQQISLAFRDCDEAHWNPLAKMNFASLPVNPNRDASAFSDHIATIRRACTEGFDRQRQYAYCERIGLKYGPQFQGVVSGLRRDGEALLNVELPSGLANTTSESVDRRVTSNTGFHFHPALLDSCFHGMIAADQNFDQTVDGLYLPHQIERVDYYQRPTRHITVHVQLLSKTFRMMRCNIHVYNCEGELCLAIENFESRRVLGGNNAESTEDLIYSYSWIPLPLQNPNTALNSDTTAVIASAEQSAEVVVASSQETADSGTNQSTDGSGAAIGVSQISDTKNWIVFVDQLGVGEQLAQRLERRGDNVVRISRRGNSPNLRMTTEQLAAPVVEVDCQDGNIEIDVAVASAVDLLDGSLSGIVYAWAIDAPENCDLNCHALQASHDLTTWWPLQVVRALEQHVSSGNADCVFVTTAAQSSDGQPEPTAVAQSPLIGLARVVASECHRLHTKLIDLPGNVGERELAMLVDEISTADNEDELLFRNGTRMVRRFGPQAGKPASADAASELAWQLQIGKSAGVEELRYRTKFEQPLQPGEIEIEVFTSGLNFSDVMKALDLYPGLPDGPVALGAECSGRVRRVSACGSRWSVGDEVVAVASGSFGKRVIVNESLVSRKPTSLTHEQACAIPVAFLTAHYALETCARLQAGETVLIHSASGGVGLAAMQICRKVGARVFATAGSEEKRQFVLELGASLAMDSRSLSFGDETLAATGGIGVDVVLNSLSGEAIQVGLKTLKPGGRFLEIGKRDIYADTNLCLYPFRNNLALFAIDLDQLFKHQPDRMGQMLAELVDSFDKNEFQPLPTKCFAADETQAAFRMMQQGRHIGKVVVDMTQPPAHVEAGDYSPIEFKPHATYWIAGGLGGFGMEIARWMSARGAGTLVLSGRSGQLSAKSASTIEAIRHSGTKVIVIPADISLAADVRRVLQQIDASCPPLAGVFHSAMVLEDKLVSDLDRPTLERVLRPKVLGSWNLHAETSNRSLDYFVLFSSLSSVFGHPGQANYAAANAMLDSLAHLRRSQGLPATVINWGHLGQVGYLAEREQLGQRLERQGVLSFTVAQATSCLEYALQNKSLQLSVLRMDWTKWRGLGMTHRVSPRFKHLLRTIESQDGSSEYETVSASDLRDLGSAERLELLESLVRKKSASLLGIRPENLPADRALLELGLDSLMAVELRNWIESHIQIGIAISSLMRAESLRSIADQLAAAIERSSSEGNQPEVQHISNSQRTEQANFRRSGSMQSEASGEELDAEDLLQQLPDLNADEVAKLLSQLQAEL